MLLPGSAYFHRPVLRARETQGLAGGTIVEPAERLANPEFELNPKSWTVFMLPVFHYELQQVSDN